MMLPRRCLSGGVPSGLVRTHGLTTSARHATTVLSRGVVMNARQTQPCARPARLALGHSAGTGLMASRGFQVSAMQLAETVKVPQMAESITEGTLKQWNKKKGDFVNADEEVATIETDKVSVACAAQLKGIPGER